MAGQLEKALHDARLKVEAIKQNGDYTARLKLKKMRVYDYLHRTEGIADYLHRCEKETSYEYGDRQMWHHMFIMHQTPTTHPVLRELQRLFRHFKEIIEKRNPVEFK